VQTSLKKTRKTMRRKPVMSIDKNFPIENCLHTFASGRKRSLLTEMLEFLKDLWRYFKERKKIWLAPVIILLLIIGAIVVYGAGSAVAPFIYTLF
jgi:hypothetical protein